MDKTGGVNQPLRTASASTASARAGLLVSRGGPSSATIRSRSVTRTVSPDAATRTYSLSLFFRAFMPTALMNGRWLPVATLSTGEDRETRSKQPNSFRLAAPVQAPHRIDGIAIVGRRRPQAPPATPSVLSTPGHDYDIDNPLPHRCHGTDRHTSLRSDERPFHQIRNPHPRNRCSTSAKYAQTGNRARHRRRNPFLPRRQARSRLTPAAPSFSPRSTRRIPTLLSDSATSRPASRRCPPSASTGIPRPARKTRPADRPRRTLQGRQNAPSLAAEASEHRPIRT